MYIQLLANSLVPLLGNNVFEDTLVHDSCSSIGTPAATCRIKPNHCLAFATVALAQRKLPVALTLFNNKFLLLLQMKASRLLHCCCQ
jgi:hypothetical protein